MTQKIIQTAEHQLSVARARIGRLEAENCQLRLALVQLTDQENNQPTINKLKLPLRSFTQRRKHTLKDTSSSFEDKSPSFARSTRASRFRQTLSPASDTDSTPTPITPKHVAVDGKSYVYHNGKITARRLGYLVSTESAINKFGDNERRREERCGVCHPTFAMPKPWALYDSEAPKDVSEECSEPAKPIQIMSQTDFEDRIERKGIVLRTRLHDGRWVWEPANNVMIDHDELFDILWRAERLEKRCLWRWLRTNQPTECRWSGLHYLSDMDLGRDRVNFLSFGDKEFYDYRWTKTSVIKQVIEDLILLRNRVHHFCGSGYTMKIVEEHLFDVQRFAVLLYDEEVATSVRALRDRLRQAAEEVAREIEVVGLLTVLPFAGDYPWQHRHIELFQRVLSKSHDGGYDRLRWQYSPAVIAAAQQYGERPGYMSWECEPDVEQSLANVRRLEKAGDGKTTQPGFEAQRGSFTRQSPPTRSRSASTSGDRSSFSHGEKTHVQESKRRSTFSVGGTMAPTALF